MSGTMIDFSTLTGLGELMFLGAVFFIWGGVYVARGVRAGKWLDEGLGPIQPMKADLTLSEIAAEIDKRDRTDQLTIMLGIAHTLTPGELQIFEQQAGINQQQLLVNYGDEDPEVADPAEAEVAPPQEYDRQLTAQKVLTVFSAARGRNLDLT